MPDATRWSARLDLAWKPVLPFDRRRSDYLEWLADAIDPVAFAEMDDGAVGVAPERRAQRVVVGRAGGSIELRDPSEPSEAVTRTLDGAFASLQSDRQSVVSYRSQWSAPIVDATYEDARRVLAGRGVPQGLVPGLENIDTSYFMESDLHGARLYYDFGVVSSGELAERVRDPRMSRLGSPFPAVTKVLDTDNLPEASVYVDLAWHPQAPLRVASAAEALALLKDLERSVTLVVDSLAGLL